jgi:GT2 family glycosyltransferase
MSIDIIIPNYNGSAIIEKALPSVFGALKNYKGKVIIVDDGSDSEDILEFKNILEKYKNKNENIKLIEHTKNKGFASAVNTGVKASDADFVVLLNSDIIPHGDFLKSPLEKLTGNENLFAVGCMDESIENGKTVLRGRGVAKWSNGMLSHSRGEVDKSDTFWTSGGSSIFRRDLYQKVGGMDEIYNPFYWEDIDLSYRARKMGFDIMFDNNSKVTHFHETGAIKSNFTASKVTTIAYRNQFIFIWKNITNVNLFINHILLLPINILRAIKSSDANLLYGFFLALIKLPAIIKKHNLQKKFYKVSDLQLINSIK